MPSETTSYNSPGQTNPDIFATQGSFPPGHAGDGRFYQWSVCLTISGVCEYQAVSGSRLITRGDVTIAKPHSQTRWKVVRPEPATSVVDAHGEQAAWNVLYMVFHPRPHWHAWLDAFTYTDGIAVQSFEEDGFDEVYELFRSAADTYAGAGVLRDERTLVHVEAALIAVYARSARLEVAADARICAAVEYIHARMSNPIGLSDIAQAAGLSVPHLSALFSAALGTSPVKYLETYRLNTAAAMLRYSAASIAQIAQDTGYTEPTYFSHRFKLQFGSTPTEYRAASRPQT